MRTRSSSNLPVVSPSNPSTLNPKHRNRRRSKQPFILEESPVYTMADQRTMAELLRATTKGYAEAIVVPPILAEQFELKHSLINMMTSDQFFGLEKDNPHDHIRWGSPSVARKEPPHSIHTWEDLVSKFINEFFPPQEQQIAVMKSLIFNNNLMNLFMRHIVKLSHAVNQQTSAVTTVMMAILKQFQATPPPAFVKVVEEICVTCGGAYPYYQCLIASGNTFPELRDNIKGYISAATVNYNQGNSVYRPLGSGSLPSNIVANPKGELKAITTRSGLVIDGTTVPTLPPFINPREDERIEETLTDLDLFEYTIKVPPPPVQKYKPLSQRDYVLHINITLSNKRKLQELLNTPLHEICSAVILKKLPEKLRDPRKFLIPCGLSELNCKALAGLGASINLMPLFVWKKLAGIARDVFVSVGKFTFPADFVIVDYESDPKVPLILRRTFLRTARALIDVYGEEMVLHDVQNDIFGLKGGNVLPEILLDLDSTKDLHPPLHDLVDELALITFPSKYDNDLQFDVEFDLKEIEFLLHQDIESSLKDSIDQSNLANNFVDSMPEMFTDEHALDYSSPSIFNEYDDDLFEVESDTENVYDDPFDSKGEKIKESKLLINELDLPCDFLLPSEYDSIFSQDFSRVIALPSTNNEDKVFNPGILIQENPFEIIIHVAKDKKLATSNASLMLEDFDPPLDEPLFFKEVPRSNMLLLFSFENEEKDFKPGSHTSEKFILLLSQKYLIKAIKFSKSTKFLRAQRRFFFSPMKRTPTSWLFLASTFTPLISSSMGELGQAK
nr:reverse transcriptase domain-containing protein [Tanacetum cinerariifolium]